MKKLLAAVCAAVLLLPATATAQITGGPNTVTGAETVNYVCKLTKKQKQKIKRGKFVRVVCRPAA